MKNRFTLLVLMCTIGFVFGVQAQDKTITGTVTDKNNVPVAGASVEVEGTSTGTATDFMSSASGEYFPFIILNFLMTKSSSL